MSHFLFLCIFRVGFLLTHCIGRLLGPQWLCNIAPLGAEYCDQPVCLCVCLPASISLEPLERSSRNFVHRSPVTVVRSPSSSLALRYVLPVLWMTPRLAVVGAAWARTDCIAHLAALRDWTKSGVYECFVIYTWRVSAASLGVHYCHSVNGNSRRSHIGRSFCRLLKAVPCAHPIIRRRRPQLVHYVIVHLYDGLSH